METLSSAAALLPLAVFAMGTIGNAGCAVLAYVRRGAPAAHQPLAMLLMLAAGCVVLAFAGLLIALAPMGRRYIAWTLLIGINVACAAANWRGRRILPVEARTVQR